MAEWAIFFGNSTPLKALHRLKLSAKTVMAAAGEMYLDSAIIVKLLVREPDSLFFDKTLMGAVLDSSELCLTEVQSALLAKERAGSISRSLRLKAVARFEELIADDVLRLHPLDRRVIDRASAILQACYPAVALRTLDALHLATCDLIRSEALCATDVRMRQAAAQLAIRLHPVDLEESRI